MNFQGTDEVFCFRSLLIHLYNNFFKLLFQIKIWHCLLKRIIYGRYLKFGPVWLVTTHCQTLIHVRARSTNTWIFNFLRLKKTIIFTTVNNHPKVCWNCFVAIDILKNIYRGVSLDGSKYRFFQYRQRTFSTSSLKQHTSCSTSQIRFLDERRTFPENMKLVKYFAGAKI